MPAPLRAGTLLVATLDLEDPNFNRTVVLIIHYSEEDGTMGLVINRPLGDQVQLYSAEELQRFAGADFAGESHPSALGPREQGSAQTSLFAV